MARISLKHLSAEELRQHRNAVNRRARRTWSQERLVAERAKRAAEQRARRATPEGRAKALARGLDYRERNREKTRAAALAYYRTHTKERQAYRAEWYEKNKDRVRKAARTSMTKTKYRKLGITAEQVAAIFLKQGKRCAICQRSDAALQQDTLGRRWCLDHNHCTGKVRGVLCNACNKAIGFLRDRAVDCDAAAAYLRQHEEG